MHLSIAGGRKTMTAFAMAAAHLVFDRTDRIWHLVSSDRLQQIKALHCPGNESAQLVPVPVTSWALPDQDVTSQYINFTEKILSPAEREVATLLLQTGLSNHELAKTLQKSPKTIANQLSRVYAKLQDYLDLPITPDRAMFIALMGRFS